MSSCLRVFVFNSSAVNSTRRHEGRKAQRLEDTKNEEETLRINKIKNVGIMKTFDMMSVAPQEMIDPVTKGQKDRSNDCCKFALDIIVGLGFILASVFTGLAYIQFSSVFLMFAAVAAITSVALIIIRCNSDQIKSEPVLGSKKKIVTEEVNPPNSKKVESLKQLPLPPSLHQSSETNPQLQLTTESSLTKSSECNCPTDLPPQLPGDFKSIDLSTSLPILLPFKEQINTEITFEKSIICSVKILGEIIKHEKSYPRAIDPIILKMYNSYENIAKLSIVKKLTEANGNVSQIAEIFKTEDFYEYSQDLKDIVLDFKLLDQAVRDLINKNNEIAGISNPLNTSLKLIMQNDGYNPDGLVVSILQSAITRMSRHEMIFKEALKQLKEQGKENSEDFEILEKLIKQLQEKNGDTNCKQTEVEISRKKFNELNAKISELKNKTNKLDSNLEIVKSGVMNSDLMSSKRIKNLGNNFVGKKDSSYLEPAERLKKLMAKIRKLSLCRGIEKDQIQTMYKNLFESEWAQKIIDKDKSGELNKSFESALGKRK